MISACDLIADFRSNFWFKTDFCYILYMPCDSSTVTGKEFLLHVFVDMYSST